MSTRRVLYIHEGGDQDFSMGDTANYLRKKYQQVCIPKMSSVADEDDENLFLQLNALREFKPDVVVGRGYGGYLLMKIVQQGFWSGPSVLLAPAVIPDMDDLRLAKAPVLLVSGKKDTRDLPSYTVNQKIAQVNEAFRPRVVEIEDSWEMATLLSPQPSSFSSSLQSLIESICASIPNASASFVIDDVKVATN